MMLSRLNLPVAKRVLAFALAAAMAAVPAVPPTAEAAAQKPKLSKTKKTLYYNKSEKKAITLKVKKHGAKILKTTWKISGKKVIKLSKKKKTSVRITAKKKGKTTVTAKIKYRAKGSGPAKTTKLKCKITSKKYTKNKADVSAAPSANNTAGARTTGNTAVTPANSSPAESTEKPETTFTLASEKKASQLFLDASGEDYKGLKHISDCLAEDIKMVADADMDLVTDKEKLEGTPVIAGSIGNNDLIDSMIAEGKLDVSSIRGKWEVYQIAIVENPKENVEQALVIVGSDMRGTIYGMFHISEMMGVSPWVYWADVAPEKKERISFQSSELEMTSKEPSVKYRGIFLNDEEPALGTWVKNFFKESKGGKFNEKFYEKVFQLLLRLKGNYLWPAMWNSAFGADGIASDDASAKLADEYGIVMGTSHHEPMMRAHQEWVRNKSSYGTGEWDFVKNRQGLLKFFDDGAKKYGKYDNIATLGMRGDGDASMLPEGSTMEENVSLLKEIITEQKKILSDNNLDDKPTVLALYKEVEDYWQGDKDTAGLKDWDGLDGVTALLSEDNYGNLRTLPTSENRDREGGWGMYYHFDYNGAPASYQWIQTQQMQKVWEQMSMAYDYGVQDIWIVNVGDLKPMEMPISYFLDMAYDFDSWGTDNINSSKEYSEEWIAQQFGKYVDEKGIKDIEDIIAQYLKLNTYRKPEIVTSSTYSIENYNEAMEILNKAEGIIESAEKYEEQMPEEAKAAYYQLVYYPAVAAANVNRIQIYSGLNKAYAKQKRASANVYASLLESAIALDKEMEQTYNKNMPGGVGDKWDGMMAQARSAAHIGYDSWRPEGAYPEPVYLEIAQESQMLVGVQGEKNVYRSGTAELQDFTSVNQENYHIDIANGGGTPFDYTVTADQEWIKLTKTSGRVMSQDTVGVSVDFSKLEKDADGTIKISGNDQEVTVKVSARVMDTSGLDSMTFVEAHDYIAIDAGHFSDKKTGEDDSEWKVIEDYGRNSDAVKAYPTTQKFTDMAKAPYVEYKINLDKAETYSMEAFFAPSNPVDADDITMKFGVSVDGGSVATVDTISSSYVAGTWRDSLWSNGVRNNMHSAKASLGSLSKGVHTVRIYAVDPALVLERLTIYAKGNEPLSSYLGPQESYYVGKEVNSSLTADIQKQSYILPCEMPAEEDQEYEMIVSKEGEYELSVEAEAGEKAELNVTWNGESVGTLSVDGDGICIMSEPLKLKCGRGLLKLNVTKGSVDIQKVGLDLLGTVQTDRAMYVRASGVDGKHYAPLAYDGSSKTYWQPDAGDQSPYLEFDFGEKLYMDKVSLSERGSNVKKYSIQVYNGTEWKDIYTGGKIESGKTLYLQGKQEICGEKLRIVFTQSDSAPMITEVSLTPYVNWSREDDGIRLTGRQFAGAGNDKEKDIEVPDTVIDGDRITSALAAQPGSNTGSSTPHTVTMEFSTAHPVDTIHVISLQEAESDSPGSGVAPDDEMLTKKAQQEYRVSYYDGENWILAGTVREQEESERKVINTVQLSECVMAEKIKVDVYTSHWLRIVELEALQMKASAGVPDYTQTMCVSEEKNKVVLSQPCEIGRIDIRTSSELSGIDDIKVEYAQRGEDDCLELKADEYESRKTENGVSLVLHDNIEVEKLNIIVPDETVVQDIELWGVLQTLGEAQIGTLMDQGFEENQDNVGSWASATLEVTKSEAHEGIQSLKVSNRTADYSCATVKIGELLGHGSPDEYTLSCYLKSGSGSMKMRAKICNSGGTDQPGTTSNDVEVNSDDWTYFEYKFKMEEEAYEVLKLETNNNKGDYYVDDIKITKPEPPCTCKVSIPYITNGTSLKADSQVTLQSETETNLCEVTGHKNAKVEYRYEILDNTCSATLAGNVLTVSKAGSVRVKVTATINGISKCSQKVFTSR